MSAVWSLVEKWKVTNAFTVPTILKMLVEDPAVDRFDHSSLRYVIYAGAPMYRTDQDSCPEEARPGAGAVFRAGRGHRQHQPCCLPALHTLEDGPAARIGTCGFERTGMQVQIQDEQGNEVTTGQTGEICVIGAGRLCRAITTTRSQRQGVSSWLVPHRRSRPHGCGRLRLHHRSLLRHVHLRRLQHLFHARSRRRYSPTRPSQRSPCSAWPDPNGAKWASRCAWPGRVRAWKEGALRDFLGDKISRYKMPKRFVFWDEMPKSAYGKIAKKLIREELQRRGDLEPSQQDEKAPA